MHSGYILQKNKLNPFHGLMLLPKPYGVERKVLVFAKVKSSKCIQLGWSVFFSGIWIRHRCLIRNLFTTVFVKFI